MGRCVVTLVEARTAYRSQLEGGASVECPCCERTGRIYRRKLNTGMARVLVRMYEVHHREQAREPGKCWVHIHEVFGGRGQKHRDWPLLRLWGLVEPRTKRTRTENARGWWRLTELGRAFVQGHTRAPAHVLVFDGERIGASDEHITIREALGSRFDYGELMRKIA